MRTTPYLNIPTRRAWEKDSWISDFRVTRKSDPVLKRIDHLLEDVGSAKDAGEVTFLDCELYFATNYWLNNYLATNNMKRVREPAVRMLRQFIETQLAKSFNCGVQMLRPRLQKLYSKTMNPHGVWCDMGMTALTEARRQKYRLIFENGKAYWLEWWSANSREATTLVVVNTEKANYHTVDDKKGGMQGLRDNWAYFALSFDRDLYIGAHMTKSLGGIRPEYHSSYLQGVPIQFAGSIYIKNGLVLGVRNDSGHYRPGDKFFINILAHLKTVGVNLKKLKMYNFEDDEILNKDGKVYRADRYLEDRGSWELVLERKQEFLLDQAALRTALGRKKIYQRIYAGSNHFKQSDIVTARNLKKLAEEQLNLALDKGQPLTFALWRETWKGICNAIAEFMPANDLGVRKYRTAWKARALKAGPPPKPRKGPR